MTQRSPLSQAPCSPYTPPQLSFFCRAHMKQQPQMPKTILPGQFLGSSHLDSSQGKQTNARLDAGSSDKATSTRCQRRSDFPPARCILPPCHNAARLSHTVRSCAALRCVLSKSEAMLENHLCKVSNVTASDVLDGGAQCAPHTPVSPVTRPQPPPLS